MATPRKRVTKRTSKSRATSVGNKGGAVRGKARAAQVKARKGTKPGGGTTRKPSGAAGRAPTPPRNPNGTSSTLGRAPSITMGSTKPTKLASVASKTNLKKRPSYRPSK